MKCRFCWASKAYRRTNVRGWERILTACLLLVPVRCHHCYQKFYVPWFVTWGVDIEAPPRPETPYEAKQLSLAARRQMAGDSQDGIPAPAYLVRKVA